MVRQNPDCQEVKGGDFRKKTLPPLTVWIGGMLMKENRYGISIISN